MRNGFLLLSVLTAIMTASCIPAQAQATATLAHTWVASYGSDSSNITCDRSSPCATFANAYGKTAIGGEISCVDSGNFQGFSISHSITINCETSVGSNSNHTNATVEFFVISANAGDVVTLRGVDIDGASLPLTGVSGLLVIQGAGTVRLEKVKVSNMHGSANGIYFNPNGTAKLQIVDSIIANNGTQALAAGIYIKPTSGITAYVAIERSVIENNGFGIFADATGGGIIKGVVLDSFVTGNTNNGINVSTSGALAVLTIDNTKVANNGYGLVAGGGAAAMLISRSVVVNNGTGLATSGGGNLFSYRNNQVNFNTPGGDGAFTQFLGLQ